MKILTISGPPRSGKDLFCQAVCNKRGYVYNYSTIDEVKKLARYLGWNGEKDEAGRKFLSDLKDAMTAYNDLPRKYVIQQIEKQIEKINKESNLILEDTIFLIQSREPEDIKRWVKENNAKSLCIYRYDLLKTWGNHADDDVTKYNYDYYLHNNSTIEDWETKSLNFIDEIRYKDWESHI